MAANVNPIYTLTPNVVGVAIGGTANTKSDGQGTIGTDMFLTVTGGANGSFVKNVQFMPVATVANTATTATTIRVYLSTKAAGATTQADTWLIAEYGAVSQNADNSTTPVVPIVVPLNRILPSGYTILVSSHVVNAANTSWTALCEAGNY